mmetsp:Transcript_13587/g.21226  ORF Transcript_13587/g.21226 Transcript_13587/m.21226 type:complete len:99 (+) Transcript_13587:561-857(+)
MDLTEGGGHLQISVSSLNVDARSEILANGLPFEPNYKTNGGSGGYIYISSEYTEVEEGAVVEANGGLGDLGGAGGVVYIEHEFPLSAISAVGGRGSDD